MGKVKDICVRAVKTAVGYIPGVGPLLSEVIDYGSSQFENKKLEEFMIEVEGRLNTLEENVEKLKSNEFGYFYFLKATKRYLEDSQKEKKQLFAECVKNGYTSDIDESKKILFLSKLAEYPVELLKLLFHLNKNNFVDESTSNHIIYYGTIKVETAICEHFPEYSNDIETLRLFIHKLQNDQMILLFPDLEPVAKEKAYGKWTTKFGEEFINFIMENEDENL